MRPPSQRWQQQGVNGLPDCLSLLRSETPRVAIPRDWPADRQPLVPPAGLLACLERPLQQHIMAMADPLTVPFLIHAPRADHA
eukprot:7865622-Pyramimonas_sp.AAC.1